MTPQAAVMVEDDQLGDEQVISMSSLVSSSSATVKVTAAPPVVYPLPLATSVASASLRKSHWSALVSDGSAVSNIILNVSVSRSMAPVTMARMPSLKLNEA